MKIPPSHFRLIRLFFVLVLLVTSVPYPARAALNIRDNPHTATQTEALREQVAVKDAIEIRADSFGLPLSDQETARLYDKPSVSLQVDDHIEFEVNIDEEGTYILYFDMAAAESFINGPEGQLLVDGAYPTRDTQRIVFPLYYQNSGDTFPLDRYGNDALIRQEQLLRWSRIAMRDAEFNQAYPVQVFLMAGKHQFEFTLIQASMLLGSIYLQPFSKYADYSQYLADNPAPDSTGVMIQLEAEFPAFKNDTSIRPINDRSLEVTPYDTYRILLNAIGGDNWKNSGTAVYYEVNAPQAGMYYLTLHALQNYKDNFTVFRRITVNGDVLFEELNEVPIGSSSRWRYLTLGGGTPYKIYLQQGVNVIGIEANSSPYRTAIENIQQGLIDINTLALEINKLTGNQVDQYKEWEITNYIPDIRERLTAIADDLTEGRDLLLAINASGGSEEVLTYQMAIDNILFLAADPNSIPYYMNRFSEGSGSAAQLLGNILPRLQNQPLAIDKIFIHSPDTPVDEVRVPFFRAISESVKRFFYSFKPNLYQSIGANENEIEVWVNRPRQYVDLLQRLTDERFTPETGINVKFSIMPNESKLTLAVAVGIQPDVALGVSTNVPYELAIRNGLYDLRSYDDFDSFIQIYEPGALLSYIINDAVFAIPETQDFWVTYYRKDILDSLGIPIPHTWNEVIQILPELQRYGMNFNTPLSSGSGAKGLLITAPYIFNYGAHLYSADGFASGLDSEEGIQAIRFMAESFTIYGMPLTTPNFYDSFRYGNLPIGVSNFETYIKLRTAAPELNGLWSIDLYPATVLPDGTENRFATGSAQASIMFAGTDMPDESWEFMKWWMSTETQVDFQQQLILNYGLEYLWNSANVEAFRFLPIPQEHKDVILEQWEWLQEPVKLPGSYMLERELSNAWNNIVFQGTNPRVAIDNSTLTINREITRKMEEFGYLQNGVVIREFHIPTIETVRAWMGK